MVDTGSSNLAVAGAAIDGSTPFYFNPQLSQPPAVAVSGKHFSVDYVKGSISGPVYRGFAGLGSISDEELGTNVEFGLLTSESNFFLSSKFPGSFSGILGLA